LRRKGSGFYFIYLLVRSNIPYEGLFAIFGHKSESSFYQVS